MALIVIRRVARLARVVRRYRLAAVAGLLLEAASLAGSHGNVCDINTAQRQQLNFESKTRRERKLVSMLSRQLLFCGARHQNLAYQTKSYPGICTRISA